MDHPEPFALWKLADEEAGAQGYEGRAAVLVHRALRYRELMIEHGWIELPPHYAQCRACRAPVLFVENVKSGERLIVDYVALPSQIELKPGMIGVLGERAKVLSKADLAQLRPKEGTTWHETHFGTCPDRDQFRRA